MNVLFPLMDLCKNHKKDRTTFTCIIVDMLMNTSTQFKQKTNY